MRNTAFFILTLFSSFCYSQNNFEKILEKISVTENPKIEDFESSVFESTNFILNNLNDVESMDFIYASKISGFWMNKKTWFATPVGGELYNNLLDKNQKFIFQICLMNYILKEKAISSRELKCLPIEGQKYINQDDVKEVRFNGIKLFLELISNPKNKILLSEISKKYIDYLKNGTLKDHMDK